MEVQDVTRGVSFARQKPGSFSPPGVGNDWLNLGKDASMLLEMSQNCQWGDKMGVLKVERCEAILPSLSSSHPKTHTPHIFQDSFCQLLLPKFQLADGVLFMSSKWAVTSLSPSQLHRSCYEFQRYRKPLLFSHVIKESYEALWKYEGRTL